MINFSELVIPKMYLWIFAVLFILIVFIGFLLFFLRRQMKQKFIESSEYKKLSLQFDKRKKLAKVSVKASKVAEPDELRGISLLKLKSKFKLDYWKHWFIEKYFPAKCVLINMELVNGFHRTFIVVEKDGGFKFRSKKYIFDDDSKYYNMDDKMYVFDFHEGITLPVKRKIPVTGIKKTIESTDEIDIEYAINPSTLQRFMTAKIAEGVMKGTLLDQFLRKLQMFIIVIMVTVVVHLLLFLYASGILENINMPF